MFPSDDKLVTDSYTIPSTWKERLEEISLQQDLNKSQLMRRILSDYFAKLDATPETPTPAPTKKLNSATRLPVAA